jgi:hypothetical protein
MWRHTGTKPTFPAHPHTHTRAHAHTLLLLLLLLLLSSSWSLLHLDPELFILITFYNFYFLIPCYGSIHCTGDWRVSSQSVLINLLAPITNTIELPLLKLHRLLCFVFSHACVLLIGLWSAGPKRKQINNWTQLLLCCGETECICTYLYFSFFYIANINWVRTSQETQYISVP